MSVTSFDRSLNEMREFATFPAATQRYIRRSLDVALGRGDPIQRWARNELEAAEIRGQMRLYHQFDIIRDSIPDGLGIDRVEGLIGRLVTVSLFDLAQGKLRDFASYRFLYERLIGAASRPWLPSSFCAAAAMPSLHPDLRRTLLQSISGSAATAPGWSCLEPVFIPEWVEKVSTTVEQ